MANTKQARKRIRQTDKRRSHNAPMRSTMRTACKKVAKAIDSKDADSAGAALAAAVPLLDRMARKGIIHKNKAARQKSRLARRVQGL